VRATKRPIQVTSVTHHHRGHRTSYVWRCNRVATCVGKDSADGAPCLLLNQCGPMTCMTLGTWQNILSSNIQQRESCI
jgi:hypothetical protein